MKLTRYIVLLLAGTMLTSCGEDFLNDLDSTTLTPDQIAQESAKNPDKTLSSQMKGCYTTFNTLAGVNASNINGHMSRGMGGIMMLSDVMSNDQSLALGTGDPWRFDHALDYNAAAYVRPAWPWRVFYTTIKSANDVINLVDEEQASAETKHLLGQAYAFRGISLAYLTQFYQQTYSVAKDKPGVPIYLSNKEESDYSRATVEKDFAQAEKDLLKAIDLLDGFQRTDKQSIDKQVAQGLLSRVYLVMNRWADAAKMAHAARQGYPINDIYAAADWNYQDLDNGEVLWGYQPTQTTTMIFASFASWRSTDGPGYGGGEVGAFQLMDAALYKSMPAGDVRLKLFYDKDQTITSSSGKTVSVPALANKKFDFVANWLGGVVYMRSSELLLNEAEGLLMSGDAAGAANVMKEYMPNRVEGWTGDGKSWTQASIYNQRRLELWGEGFGYFDCLRLKQDLVRKYEGTNETVGLQNNVPHTSYKWIYQIPKSEIDDNENITDEDQNPLQ